MRKSFTQLKREFWECRASFIRTPVVMAAILMGLLLLGIVPLQNRIGDAIQHSRMGHPDAPKFDPQFLQEFGKGEAFTTDPGYLLHGLATVYSLFALVLILVLVFYFVDTLYSDRRDQSILFWKSLPVGEHRSLLTKLAAGIAGAPLFYAAAAVVTGAFFLLVFLVYAGIFWKIPVPGFGTVLLTFLKSTVGLVLGWWFLVLWLLPFFCWLLFSSAYAKKAPFLLALGVPLALMVLEGWVLGSISVLTVVKNQFAAGFHMLQVLLHNPAAVLDQLSAALTSSQMWIGLVLSAALLLACVWLRNNRWEI